MNHRAVTIVLDGVGVGALPDAGLYGDEGANSIANTAIALRGLGLPTMERLGLGNICPIEGLKERDHPVASWGRMAEQSPGKDSISGHWELMGCPLKDSFPTYPNGFPGEIINEFESKAGCSILGNIPASGTEIIEKLGPEHIHTGKPIVYTSADSVFQIATHEDIISVKKLYHLREIAREILIRPHHVARVIARPFTGEPGSFVRTSRRRDFSLPPPRTTLLDILSGRGYRVVTVGKIHNLFVRRGIDEVIEATGNNKAMELAGRVVRAGTPFSFLFINLIDFDMLWGHRRDVRSYAMGLEAFDAWLDGFLELLQPGTLVSITADHGCDPTMLGSDHTREYVPILSKLAGSNRGVSLGTRSTFADLAATIAQYFGLHFDSGKSFLDSLG